MLDTNVISEAAPSKKVASPELRYWMDANSDRLFLSVITVAEIVAGIEKVKRAGHEAKAARLGEWLATLVHLYARRILPVDLPVSQALGTLTDQVRARGHDPQMSDLTIAATARVHGLTVLTRNVRHFQLPELVVVNPFEELPDNPLRQT
nr:type II toxin-antitoxin system VapC family toxin [Acetobacter fallax]